MAGNNIELIGNSASMQEMLSSELSLQVLNHRIQSYDTFIVQDSSAAYLPIEIDPQYASTNSRNIVRIQGANLSQPDPTKMVYNLPDSHRFLFGILNIRLRPVGNARTFYAQAVEEWGENYHQRSVLNTLRAYNVASGTQLSMVVFSYETIAKSPDDHARLVIEGYSDQQYDYADFFLCVQP